MLDQPKPPERETGAQHHHHHHVVGIDALLPDEIASKVQHGGAEKARMAVTPLLTLAVLAGAFIGFGALFAMGVTVGTDAAGVPAGFSALVGGIAFSLALVLVIIGGAELFTSNNLMVIALVSGRIRSWELVRAWVVIYIGNLLGAIATAAISVAAAISRAHDSAIGAKATAVAARMAELDGTETFFAGMLGNVLVCLAVWISYSGRTTTDRILAVTFPITAFYALGLEHVIATMFYFPLAYFHALAEGATAGPLAFTGTGADVLDLPDFLAHLGAVTAGNVVGGGVLVGTVYWFIYLRRDGLRR